MGAAAQSDARAHTGKGSDDLAAHVTRLERILGGARTERGRMVARLKVCAQLTVLSRTSQIAHL